MSDDTMRVAHAFFKAFKEKDVQQLLALTHPECTLHEPPALPYGGKWGPGPDGMLKLLTAIGQEFDVDLGGYELFPLDARFLALPHAIFTSKRSGRTTRASVVELYTVKDEKIVRADIFYKDPIGLMTLHDPES